MCVCLFVVVCYCLLVNKFVGFGCGSCCVLCVMCLCALCLFVFCVWLLFEICLSVLYVIHCVTLNALFVCVCLIASAPLFNVLV